MKVAHVTSIGAIVLTVGLSTYKVAHQIRLDRKPKPAPVVQVVPAPKPVPAPVVPPVKPASTATKSTVK